MKHITFIKPGFRCGILTYLEESDVDFEYAENWNGKCDGKLVVHSAPHVAHGPDYARKVVNLVLRHRSYDLYIHERTVDVMGRLLKYDELIKYAESVYVHSYDGSVMKYVRNINSTCNIFPLVLPYTRRGHAEPERQHKAVYIGRDTETKDLVKAKQFCHKNKLELDVVTKYDRSEVINILSNYRYAVLPIYVEGSFSLEYTAYEAMDAGCIVVLDPSWRKTEAVKPYNSSIIYTTTRVPKPEFWYSI